MRTLLRLAGALFSLVVLLVVALSVGAVFLFGTDTGKDFVRHQTAAAVDRLLGPSYTTDLGEQTFELRPDATLAINWNGVSLKRKDRPDQASNINRISVALRLMPLVGGTLEFGRLEIEGARIDVAAFGESGRRRRPPQTINPAETEADDAPRSVIARTADGLILTLERQLAGLQAFHFDTVSFQNIAVEGLPGRLPSLDVRIAELHRDLDGDLRLATSLKFGALPLFFQGRADFASDTNRLQSFALRTGRVQLASVLPPASLDDRFDERPFGSDSDLTVTFQIDRDPELGTPIVNVNLGLTEGNLQLGLNRTRVQAVDLRLEYRGGEDKLRLLKSPMRFTDVAFDAEGDVEPARAAGVADQEQLHFRFGSGSIRSNVGTKSSEPARMASLWAEGNFDREAAKVTLDRLELLTQDGRLTGNGVYDGATPASLTSLNIDAAGLSAKSVKAFWPFNISGRARDWVLNHVGDEGVVPKGSIGINVRRDRLDEAFKPESAPTDQELRVDLALENMALSTVGDMPRLHAANGRLETRGGVSSIFVDNAEIDAHEAVTLDGSSVVLSKPADGDPRDLGIELDVQASGEVRQLLDIANREPINALRTLDLDPAKATGTGKVAATAEMRVGRNIDREDQVRSWFVEADLNHASPGQPIQGRSLTDLSGPIRIIPGQASGSLDGAMDGLPSRLTFAFPFGKTPVGSRSVEVKIDAKAAQVVDVIPSLRGIVGGGVKADITDDSEGLRADVDLTEATLSVPVIAWKKGQGIPARMSLKVDMKGDETSFRDVALKGEGFHATGAFTTDKAGIKTADLTDVALNPSDAITLKVDRRKNGFGIRVGGSKLDARPFLAQLKSSLGEKAAGASKRGGETFDVEASIDQLGGFGNQSIDGFTLNYASSGGRTAALNLSGALSGKALSGDLAPRDDRQMIRVASEDVGSLLKFVGAYMHMEGGRGTISVLGSSDAGYQGQIAIEDFNLVDEPRLSSIVTATPKAGTASLSQAVGQDLTTERAYFDHASAKLGYDDRGLRVADGIVRGPVFGSSFAGTLYDKQGRIDIAGSFMPAYGINRVFGAIPILGQILGNGNEGGLIGITYHLSGLFSSPSLTVNPISVIAPGIFREIFSYEERG